MIHEDIIIGLVWQYTIKQTCKCWIWIINNFFKEMTSKNYIFYIFNNFIKMKNVLPYNSLSTTLTKFVINSTRIYFIIEKYSISNYIYFIRISLIKINIYMSKCYCPNKLMFLFVSMYLDIQEKHITAMNISFFSQWFSTQFLLI